MNIHYGDERDNFESLGGGYVKLKDEFTTNMTSREWKRLLKIAPGNLAFDTAVMYDIFDRIERLEKLVIELVDDIKK